jgi:hypothetical protein
MTAPRAETLFHFTKSLDVVKLILKNGYCPRYCLEDVEWQEWGHELIAYAMTCFCDIPLSRITEHTDFYGQFGLGMTKEWGLRNSLNPVIYFPPSGLVSQHARYLLGLNLDDADEEDRLNGHTFDLFKLMKPIRGKMVIAGKILEKNFYQESEWRYAPKIDNMIYKDEFDKECDNANVEAASYSLRFTPADVRYIFVPSDAEIPALCDFITTEMGAFPLNDLKILQTRIVSLENIAADV